MVDKMLKLAAWNANGLTQHAEELKMFISTHNINFILISETRFTEKSYLKFLNIQSTTQTIQLVLPEEDLM
jgi:exonuclease III